ncbi:hypothetical protein CHLNCDRAFT_52849 [Chlorella variabilis]|uniref:DNA replication licensing factor MCM7 n=1 Tax=Chlorella variabilis TaxID=554065 RepID=E1ZH77_CHLVA|nr:hypothetical protein CHLNCDRAFT_52849 [Chlorella variabilis]EFN55074.1 hypothetical protein CHLNCDRAFT_52849 [Chlorella variabilis]|eukprot:XP_005847176.1 hypothetical protein CHLNCDRAFT_52849 [Chlorella variabilis]
MEMLQDIANRQRSTLDVDLDDLDGFSKDPELVEHVEGNTQQYLRLLAEAADNIMPAPTDDNLPEDVFDVLLDQRRRAQEMTRAQMEVEGRGEQQDPNFALPPSLLRRYEVLVRPRSKMARRTMRDISADCIGSLCTFRGIVTQVSDVRPLLTVATYLDDQTGFEIYQEVSGKSFNPLQEAPDEVKKMNGGKSELFMQVRGSKFVKYQECKIQESPDEVPQGSTPRTLMVHLRGSLTRSLKAGGSVTLSGIFLPEPYTGQRAMLRASLLTSTYMEMLRAYIAAAKQYDPFVPEGLTDYLAAVYAEMRAEEAASDVPHSYTTARTLLSILRLSQALARLRFADAVEQSDVDEALRLLKMSKASLYDDAGVERAVDPISQIFSRIRQHAERTKRDAYSWADLLDFLGTSFKPEQIRQCLVDYASINVWQLAGADSEAPSIALAAA